MGPAIVVIGSKTRGAFPERNRLSAHSVYLQLTDVWSDELKAGLEKEVSAMSDAQISNLPDALGSPSKLVVHKAHRA